ncbi:response regulator [Pseudoalteromonas maricaloris]|uniref:PAS domain-containing hybrid sensor histidine kinase/response regulator n=1 Tax=Pseudoalteromonas maricaloris TaxID=184924 RepID=UPI003C28C462
MNRLENELYHKVMTNRHIFNFIQESSLDGLWYWNLEQPEEEWMSPKFWTTLGYDPSTKQHCSSEWQDIINQDDLKSALDNYDKHLKDPSYPYDQIVRYRHALGHTVWIRCRGLIIRDDNDKPIRMIGAHTDVTELKVNEQKAIDALSARDNFFARMSHEIRTPLFGMLGVTESLLADTTNENIKEDLNTILNCGEQLQRILNDILTLAKIDAGKLALSIEVVSLSSVLSHLHFLFAKTAKAKNLTLSVNTKDCLNMVVDTDRVRLLQVLSNIVSNAIKYTNEGCVTISAVQSDAFCLILIQDTGVGIEDVNNVLQPFEQETNNRSHDVNSTGLGLDVVSHLCELLNLEFSIRSTVGQGTEVAVRIPARVAKPTEEIFSKERTSISNVELGRVLLVDDNAINLIVGEKMLEPCCTSLHKAKDGLEALNLIKQNPYDIILLDINMPRMDGLEVLKQLKQLSLPYRPKVFMLSADAYETTKRKCLVLGCDGFLTKPFTKEQLLLLLQR